MGERFQKNFEFVMENFSGLETKRYSDQFIVGGCKWRVLVFPKGNNVDCLSVYLDVVEANSLPSGWRRHAYVCICVVNQLSEQSSKSIVKETWHWFNAHARDWGFTSMMTLAELHNKDNGYLVDNKLIIEVEVDVLEVIGKLDVSEKSEMAAEPRSKAEGPLVADAPAVGPQGNSLSHHERKIVDASKENSDDDASEEDSDHDTLPAVSEYGAGDRRTETETVDVNGFQVLSSQVKSVTQIFSKHPDIASNSRPKTQRLRTAYMNVLLSLIETLCRPPLELSEDDFSEADNSLADLMDVGFKLDWLKPKLEEVRKRKMEQSRHQGLEAELQKLILRVRQLKAELENEKAETATKGPLSFDDVV